MWLEVSFSVDLSILVIPHIPVPQHIDLMLLTLTPSAFCILIVNNTWAFLLNWRSPQHSEPRQELFAISQFIYNISSSHIILVDLWINHAKVNESPDFYSDLPTWSWESTDWITKRIITKSGRNTEQKWCIFLHAQVLPLILSFFIPLSFSFLHFFSLCSLPSLLPFLLPSLPPSLHASFFLPSFLAFYDIAIEIFLHYIFRWE